MRTSDHLQVVRVVELLRDVLAEGVARSSRVHAPTRPVVRVTPQQVAHRPLVRHLLESFQRSDVIQGLNTRGKAAVQAKELPFHHGR